MRYFVRVVDVISSHADAPAMLGALLRRRRVSFENAQGNRLRLFKLPRSMSTLRDPPMIFP